MGGVSKKMGTETAISVGDPRRLYSAAAKKSSGTSEEGLAIDRVSGDSEEARDRHHPPTGIVRKDEVEVHYTETDSPV
jgi:hypothetical protein